MLLLTTVAFGGQEALPDFDHLPASEGALLRHRAEQLLEIPREKRIPLLIHELKRRMAVQRSQLLSVEPQALAALLASERQAVAEVVLRALPASHAEQVRALLPPITVKLQREVRPDVINAVRWKLEARLAQSAAHLPLRFVDVLLFEPRDHYGLCDRLGARALATAVAGLSAEARATFDAGLTPDQRALADAAADLVRARALNPEDAQELISIHQGDGTSGDALRSAGAQRLARACIAQSPELAARLLEKHRGGFGQMFMHWVREERGRARPGDGGRTEVLAELEAMVREGVADRPLRAPPRKVKPATPPPAAAPVEARSEPEGRAAPAPRRPSAPGLVVGAPPAAEVGPDVGGERRRPTMDVAGPRRTGEGEAVFRPRAGAQPVSRSERSGEAPGARGSGQRAELRPGRRDEPSRPRVTGSLPEARDPRRERREEEGRPRVMAPVPAAREPGSERRDEEVPRKRVAAAGPDPRRERRAEEKRPRATGDLPQQRAERSEEIIRPKVTGAIPEIRAAGREEARRRPTPEKNKPVTSPARPRVTGAVPTPRRPTGEAPEREAPGSHRLRPATPPGGNGAAARPPAAVRNVGGTPLPPGPPLGRGSRKPVAAGKGRSQEFRASPGPRRNELAGAPSRPFPTGRPRLGALGRAPLPAPAQEEPSVAGPPPPRRDPIAERAARAGGAVSIHARPASAKPRDASLPRPRGSRKGPAS